jgi:2-oxoglutarate dehydrogenase E2 component (dihydrolipoamide succinyltransferase)
VPGTRAERVVPMSRIRKRIAERLVDAQRTAAILTTFNEIDMTAAMELRGRYKEQFAKKHGVGLGFMSLFGVACIAALKDVPAVNGEIRGDDVVYRDFVHLGIAVGTERGLVVPVVRDADQLSIADLEKEIARLAGLARDGKLVPDDLMGGTFTISNGGVYGSLLSTPILNPPQSGILGMHKIEKRPIVVNDQVVIRPMMYVALSYDHRLVDGEQAVTFLIRVKERLEDPARLVLNV